MTLDHHLSVDVHHRASLVLKPRPRAVVLWVLTGWCLLLSSLAAEVLGQTSVALEWNANPEDGIVDYVVYYGTRSRRYAANRRSGGQTNIVITKLKPGLTYYFAVAAVNWADLQSDFSDEVSYTVPGPYARLEIRKHGLGSVRPDLDGRELLLGRRYAVTGVPDVGQVCLGWSGAATSTTPTLSFVMERDLIIEVNFGPSPFLVAQGTYQGLISATNAASPAEAGAISVAVTDRGSYSGRLTLGGRRHPFSGQLAFDRMATNTLLRPGQGALTLELRFGADRSEPAQGRLAGADGLLDAPLLAWRSFYHAKTNPAPFQGTYTVVFPGQTEPSLGPEGAGAASLSIDASGNASIAGTLADGTRISQRVALSQDGQWPLSIPIRAGQGLLQGWLSVNSQPSNNISGTARWIQSPQLTWKYYPEGFTSELQALGTRYQRPASAFHRILPLAETTASFSGGNLIAPFTNLILLADRNRVENRSDNPLTLTFNLARGLFSGTVVDPASGKPFRYTGAVLQSDAVGWGLLLGSNRTARVTLGF